MDQQSTPSSRGAGNESTIDSPSPGLSSNQLSASQYSCDRWGRPMELLEGTRAGLTVETVPLLRSRLRLAAGILLIGTGGFLVQHVMLGEFATLFDWLFLGFHLFVTLALSVITAMLCWRHEFSVGRLRLIELAAFALPFLLLVVIQHVGTLRCCVEMEQFRLESGVWLVLMYTYVLFIPNTPRRAAMFVIVIAAAPVVIMLVMMWRFPSVAQLVATEQLTQLSLLMLVAAGGGILGVGTMGSLRREIHEKREFGQYRLRERIGAGGMGEVFLAEHQMLKRPCVIKLIRPDKAGDERLLARFQREVQATARLSHWNTIDVFDYGRSDDGTFYYVMEFLPGLSLGELVERHGPLSPARTIYFLRQACDALAEAHAAGLIHRDIKPGNIFAADRGGQRDVVKLLDFGLVKPLLEDDSAVQLTLEGSITGSPLFMSPQQAIGEKHFDARGDLYSLGAVAYYLLTGRPPFVSDKVVQVMIAHAHEPVVPPSEHCQDLPADLEAVVIKCLAKDPSDRYPDATAMGEALSQCEAAGGWSPAAAAQWWREKESAAGQAATKSAAADP